MENDARFRHELKYLITKQDMECCLGRIAEFTERDLHAKNGQYYIRSLYFDDMYGSAYEDKESGVLSRYKYRIRIYDMDDSFIRLEKKIKQGSYVRKESVMLTRSEYDMIMNGDTAFLLKKSEKCANDFAVGYRVNMVRPEVIVDYERIPFVYRYGDVRITFDMNVRASRDIEDIFDSSNPSYNVLKADRLIMEVKYTHFFPDVIRCVLPNEGCRMTASKYVLCDDVKRSFK